MVRSESAIIARQLFVWVLSTLIACAALGVVVFYVGWQAGLALLLIGPAVAGLFTRAAGSVRRLARAAGGGRAGLILAASGAVIAVGVGFGMGWRTSL